MTVPPQDGWRPDHDQPAGPSQPPPTVNGLKWLLIAVAVLLVVGISVDATLIVTRGGKGAATKPALRDNTSDIASANDIGPVSIITDEPTCQTFHRINNSLADVQKNGWGEQRRSLGPASDWTVNQRSQVQAVATAMRNSADQMIPLAKKTPHRLIRELYEQFIAYGRAYADSVQRYVPSDDAFASANINLSGALFGICESIETGSANRSIVIRPGVPPTKAQNGGNLVRPERFLSSADNSCASWQQSSDRFNANTAEWQRLNTATSATQWTPRQRSLNTAAVPFVASWAYTMQSIGIQSSNPVLEDFAVAANLYLRAFLAVGDNYIGSDSWLTYIGYRINQTVLAGCRVSD